MRLTLAEADPARPGRPGASAGALDADCAVLAPGPYARPLLAGVGVDLALQPVLEQVTYVRGAGPAWESLPCLVDGPAADRDSFVYAMPTAGFGYKIGMEQVSQRPWPGAEPDREPSPALDRAAEAYAGDVLGFTDPAAHGSTVCCWTHSPDDAFVADRLAGDRVVVACGDSGRGFKFSALMGEWLADLAEGRPVDDDQRWFGLARLTG